MNSMNDITNAFISHLVENKYVGPGVPTTVGITESYLKRVFDMVFKQQYSRNNQPIDDISPSEVIQFMVTNGYLVIDHGQVAAFPQHNIVCPITTSIILKPRHTALMKNVRINHLTPIQLLCTSYPMTDADMDKLVSTVTARKPTLVFLHDTGFSGRQGRKEVSWPNYGFIRKDRYSRAKGGVVLHKHSKLDVTEVKSESDFSVLWFTVKEKKILVDQNGFKKDRLTLVCCISQEEGDSRIAEYLLREVAKLIEQFGETTNIILCGSVNDDRVKESMEGLEFNTVWSEKDSLLMCRSQIKMFVETPTNGGQLFKQEDVNCHFCNIGFKNREELVAHKQTGKHKKNLIYLCYQKNREALLVSPHQLGLAIEIEGDEQGISLDEEMGVVVITSKPREPKTFKIRVKNIRPPEGEEDSNNPKGIVLESFQLAREENVFHLHDERGLIDKGQKLRLKYTMKYRVSVRACSAQIGHYRVPVIVGFYNESHSTKTENRWNMSYMAVELLLKVQTDEMKELRPKAPFKPPKQIRKWQARETVAGKKVPTERNDDLLRKTEELKFYDVSAVRAKIISKDFIEGETVGEQEELVKCKNLLEDELLKETYKDRWELLLHCEETQLETDIRHYDMADTVMKLDKNRRLFILEVPGLEENRPSVMRGDRIFVLNHADNKEYEGYVHLIQEDKVLLGFSERLIRGFVNNMKFDVRFTVGRFPLRNMHRAVELAESSGILGTLFPNRALISNEMTVLPSIRCYDRKIESNNEQLTAVQHIVSGSSGRCPYIVFGPPGTGKTVTMVEAIKQVVKLNPNCHVLATAPSNTAADLLADRLISHVHKRDIRRINASSRLVTAIPTSLREVSNLSDGKLVYPVLEQLLKYRVIVTTLVTAGRLVSAQFSKDHFTHIFIDESGQATEPETVIPLAGLMNSRAQVVMAGDPKQLGPVIRSKWAVKFGLDISLLERLMDTETYSKNYDKRCITKLLKNFRSHHELLTIPKTLYYDNELYACADERMTNSCLNFSCLTDEAKRNKVPLIFHGVVGQDLKEESSPSFFNVEEIIIVMEYIKQVLDVRENRVSCKEIGVITPYRRQVQKIRNKLQREGLQDIMVGGTEEFQGQERRVIIISTVRSTPEYVNTDNQFKLGFLANPKRFNVAITRARALLIIVGNPHILSQDADWIRLLEFSVAKGCYKGCDYNQESDEDLDRMATRFSKLLINDESEISRLTRLEDPAWRIDM